MEDICNGGLFIGIVAWIAADNPGQSEHSRVRAQFITLGGTVLANLNKDCTLVLAADWTHLCKQMPMHYDLDENHVWYLSLEWPVLCIRRGNLESPLPWNIHPFGEHPRIGSFDRSLEQFIQRGPPQYRSAPRKRRHQLGTRIVDEDEWKAGRAATALAPITNQRARDSKKATPAHVHTGKENMAQQVLVDAKHAPEKKGRVSMGPLKPILITNGAGLPTGEKLCTGQCGPAIKVKVVEEAHKPTALAASILSGVLKSGIEKIAEPCECHKVYEESIQ